MSDLSRSDKICLLIAVISLLAAVCLAGHEDMNAQLLIDKQEIKEHVERVLMQQEEEAANYLAKE